MTFAKKRRKLDALLRATFRRAEAQPAPEHLVDLVDRLDQIQQRPADRAA